MKEQDAQFAAEFDADVAVEKIAGMYADAFLDALAAQGEPLAEQVEQFDSLVNDLFAKHPTFEAILASSLVSPDEKIGILDRTLKTQASKLFLNFLKVVAKHGRLDILRSIHRETRKAYEKRLNRIPVKITTAVPLDEPVIQSLTSSFRKILGGDPIFQTTVDPEVIGGIVVRVGDTIYDASLLTQLKNVRQQMIDRSAHEIQSRRNRFSNTEGN
ncbi:MAG: ATP synthase F1 subunit delta [Planctomycetaceae bacterium]|nr:ATP synthase F1 subunit delta [Planctomycetaceae bacterium]MCL2306368.1 ATP synthase F1 subunit delta [Planctomycetaceae bacterium]